MQAMPGLVDNGGIPRCPAGGLCPFQIKTDVSEQPLVHLHDYHSRVGG